MMQHIMNTSWVCVYRDGLYIRNCSCNVLFSLDIRCMCDDTGSYMYMQDNVPIATYYTNNINFAYFLLYVHIHVSCVPVSTDVIHTLMMYMYMHIPTSCGSWSSSSEMV